MKKTISYEKYNPLEGIRLTWEKGFIIKCSIQDESVLISANKEGLISLANHFLSLAQDAIPEGSHLHFDDGNCLEDGSVELILEKQ